MMKKHKWMEGREHIPILKGKSLFIIICYFVDALFYEVLN